MKIRVNSLFTGLLFCASIISQAQCLSTATIPGEPTIYLPDFVKSASDGRIEEVSFRYHFRYQENENEPITVISDKTDIIPMADLLCKFYKPAKDAIDAAGTTVCPTGKCFTALKITFAMHNKTVKFLYQPAYLAPQTDRQCKKISKNPNAKRCGFNLNVVNENDYLYFDESSQSFKSANTASIQVYQDSVRIRHFETRRKIEPHNGKEGSWLGDSQSIIFSFQEIVHIYNENYRGEVDGHRYTEKMKIHNGAASYEKGTPLSDLVRKARMKHTVFVSSEDWLSKATNKILIPKSANGDVGNLAHLCPPSCNGLNYPIVNP